MPRKKTICIDFDGVLAEWHGDFRGGGLGPPLPGARRAVHLLARDFQLICFTARPNVNDIHIWLRRHGFPEMRITNVKPPSASIFLDDRAITFTAWTDHLLDQIKTFEPHWKKASEQQISEDKSAEKEFQERLGVNLMNEDGG